MGHGNGRDRPRVFVRVTGGLGNQMFQYAAALAFARRWSAELLIDTSCYDYTHETHRAFALAAFRITAPVATPTRASRFLFKLAAAGRPGAGAAASLARWLLRLEPVVEKRAYVFDPSVVDLCPSGNVHLLGYWQSPRYFADRASEVRREFTPNADAAAAAADVVSRVERSPSVSVHVRRGDYVTARPGAVLPIEYYRRAFAEIQALVPHAEYFIFSDDIEWTKASLPNGGRITFVDGLTDFGDFCAMAACRHHIIANSSFSWWGAWLRPSSGGAVVAPRHWMGPAGGDFGDLLPDEWILLV